MFNMSSVTLNSNPKKSRKRGRPTLYKPEYCEQVVEWGREGCSLHQIASRMGISLQCFAEWREKYKQFGESVTRARDLAQAWWEDVGMSGMRSREFNARVWEISVRNRFPESYRDQSTLELSGSLTVAGIKDEDLLRAQALLVQPKSQQPK